MSTRIRRPARFPVGLSAPLLGTLFVTLLIAGGASREGELGQAVVRAVAWLALAISALFGPRPDMRPVRPVLVLLVAALALVLLQLVPLPPTLWQALPGRDVLTDAAVLSGQPQPWRPLAIVPGAAINAAGSLVVPFAVLVLVASLDVRERRWLPDILLGLIVVSALVGLLQFSGASFDNLFINESVGQVGGTFANRNHFALFLAFGCLLAPAWPFLERRRLGWRGPTALGLVLMFALVIMGTGSRAGLILGALGIAAGLVVAGGAIRRSLRRAPRWAFPALVTAIIVLLGVAVLASVAAGRAGAIDRALVLDAGQDMRHRALPTLIAMTREYFPFGAGVGGFDPLFRLHEPFNLLKPTFFNHAHNDLLEVVLGAGLPGLLLLAAALLWWGWASVRAWRTQGDGRTMPPLLGSALLLLVLVASAFDYPARTPTIMAVMVVAATWLAAAGSALPKAGQHL